MKMLDHSTYQLLKFFGTFPFLSAASFARYILLGVDQLILKNLATFQFLH